jgi:hypothetical protein
VVFEEALVLFLKSDPGVAALAGQNVWPVKAPQKGGYPRVLYQQVSGRRLPSLLGPLAVGFGRWTLYLQTSDPLGQSYDQLKGSGGLVAAVLTATGGDAAAPFSAASNTHLDGFKGLVSGGSGQVEVQGATLLDRRDHHYPPVHDDDVGVFEVQLDFSFYYVEDV